MALETHNLLLPDFLATLSRNISVSRIDFSQTPLPEYSGFYAVILDDVMSEEECELLIKAAESSTSKGWERAKVDIGGGSQALDFEYHNCSLIMWNSAETVAKIWKRIENIPEVQEIVRLQSVPKITGNFATRSGEVWRFTRPHEYMRFLKYQRGGVFARISISTTKHQNMRESPSLLYTYTSTATTSSPGTNWLHWMLNRVRKRHVTFFSAAQPRSILTQ